MLGGLLAWLAGRGGVKGKEIGRNADPRLNRLVEELSRLSWAELVRWADAQLRVGELEHLAENALKHRELRPRKSQKKRKRRLEMVTRIGGRWYEWATNPRRRAAYRRHGWSLALAITGAAMILFVQQVGGASTVDGQTSFTSTAVSFTAGSLLVALASSSYSGAGASTTIDVPTGWTAPLATKNNGAPNGGSRAYYMASNPGGSQSWTWNITIGGGGAALGWAYTIYEFSGVAGAGPLDLTVVNNATGASASTSLDSTAASGTTQAGDLLLELVGVQRSAAGTLSTDTTNSVPTTGWTVGTQYDGINSTVNAHASGQHQILAGTQASPRGVLTSTISESSESWLLTFQQAPPAPGFFASVGKPGPR